MTNEQLPQPDGNRDPRTLGYMRAENESDRSEEFKVERNLFVNDVNEWLSGLAAARDEGKPVNVHTDNGTFAVSFLDRPRRVRSDLGPVNHRVRAMAEETNAGVWLGGNGHSQPYHLQAFFRHGEQGVQKYLDVRGTDPTAQAVYGDSFDSGRSNLEVVAETVVEYTDETGQEQTRRYSVRGSGAMSASTTGVDGVMRGGSTRSEADVAAARQVFNDEIASSLTIN